MFATLPANDAATFALDGPAVLYDAYAYDERHLLVGETQDDGADPAMAESDGIQPASKVERIHRDVRGNAAVSESGRPGQYLLNTFDGFDNVLLSTTFDPTGCKGANTPLRRIEHSGYTMYDKPTTTRVYGDDGTADLSGGGLNVSACSTDRKLREKTRIYDQWGRLREEAVKKFAVDPASDLTHTHFDQTNTTKFTWDMQDQLHLSRNEGYERQVGRTIDGQVCAQVERVAPELGTPEDVLTQRWYFDSAGKPVRFTEVHGDEGSVTQAVEDTSFTHDLVGRIIEATDAVGQVMTYRFDAMGRRRALRDKRGVLHERRYDQLNNRVLEYQRGSGPGKARGQRFTYASSWLREQQGFVAPERLAYDPASTEVHQTTSYAYDGYGLPALTWPHGRTESPNRRERRTHDPDGNVTQWVQLNKTTITSTFDALGNNLTATVQAPWPSSDKPQAHSTVSTTAQKRFRYNGAGWLTIAQGLEGTTLQSTVRRFYDSTGAILEEENTVHTLPESAQTFRTRAAYNAQGAMRSLAHAGAPEGQWTVNFDNDAAGRVTKASAPLAGSGFLDNLARIESEWTGRFPRKRQSFALGSPSLEPWTTEWHFNALGDLYYIENEHPTKDGLDSRVWFSGQDRYLVANQALNNGNIAGDIDLLQNLDTGSTASHLVDGFDKGGGFQFDANYLVYAGSSLSSSFTANEHDGFGMATRTFTTNFPAGSGKAQHSLSWTSFDGFRQKSHQSLIWNISAGAGYNAVEVKNAELIYANEPAANLLCATGQAGPHNRVCFTRHTILKEADDPDILAEYPLIPALNGLEAGNGSGNVYPSQSGDLNRYQHYYSDGDKLVIGSAPNLGPDFDRFEQDYDLFDRLVESRDRIETGNCGANACFATKRFVTYDALDRPLWEDFDLPSEMPDEKPRRFVYFGQDRIQEVHFQYTYIFQGGTTQGVKGSLENAASGLSTYYLRGPGSELLWIDHPFIPADLIPIEDVTGRYVGVYDAFLLEVRQLGTDIALTSDKPRSFVSLGDGANVDRFYRFRWTSKDVEASPFDLTSYSSGQGWFKDFRADHSNNGWDAFIALNADIAANRKAYDLIAIGITAPFFILPIGVIAEASVLLMEVLFFAEAVARGDWTWWDAAGVVLSIGGVYLSALSKPTTALHFSEPLKRRRMFQQRQLAQRVLAKKVDQVNDIFDDLQLHVRDKVTFESLGPDGLPQALATKAPDPPPRVGIDPMTLANKVADIELGILEKRFKLTQQHAFDAHQLKHEGVIDLRYAFERTDITSKEVQSAMMVDAAIAKMDLMKNELANLRALRTQAAKEVRYRSMTATEILTDLVDVADDFPETTARGVASQSRAAVSELQSWAVDLDDVMLGRVKGNQAVKQVTEVAPKWPWARAEKFTPAANSAIAAPRIEAPIDPLNWAYRGARQ